MWYPVSTHSRAKAAAELQKGGRYALCRFNTQPREGGCHQDKNAIRTNLDVSTHSRAKAAAAKLLAFISLKTCFNTQPREGGCVFDVEVIFCFSGFNTQPREGGCIVKYRDPVTNRVSTHSRAKAAAVHQIYGTNAHGVSTHSRAKAAACNGRD